MKENYNQEPTYIGLSGWLILFWVYLIIGILSSIFILFSIQNIYNSDLYLNFALAESVSYINGVKEIIIANIIYAILSIPLLLYLFVAFRKKLAIFPKHMSIYLVLPPIASLVLYFMQASLKASPQLLNNLYETGGTLFVSMGNLTGGILASIILILYLRTSKRAKNTFIN